MKKVLILGAGMVTKPMVDYFLDRCKYHVVIATRTISKAEQIINGRSNAKAISWTTDDRTLLDKLVVDADIVISMLPPTQHIPVAKACIKYKKNMVTTSYLNPGMLALDKEAKEQNIIILNEIGEDPGIDHMGAKRMIDEVKDEGGRVVSLTSYGAGLPSFEYNRNPFGYKFSWSPKGVLMAARTPAAYLKEGKRIDVPAELLFDHHWLIDIEGLGTFETYPNRDSTGYRAYYELDENVSLYRGLLRFTGWCNTLGKLKKLNLLDDDTEQVFENKTYREFTASLTGNGFEAGGIAKFLSIEENDDIIKRLKWLGLLDDKKITLNKGTNADLLVDLMLKKMSYQLHEKDMIIIHDEIVAKFEERYEKRMSTMRVEGIPGGDSAMSRAVSLPAAIASKLILENKIASKGVHIPVLPEIYNPVLDELEVFGYKFKHTKIKMDY
ncbi:MAG: saccharopine dehydrogenase NADP-binding domain-containing protein [Bacteroidetes bacterium]|nr:saccharopine dehydrogenase NADP-binding domain-containing protein [Bacteroidota bacterium]